MSMSLLLDRHLPPVTQPRPPALPPSGAYSPADPSDIPEEVADLIAEAFLAGNATYKGQPFQGCPATNATLLQACQQVGARGRLRRWLARRLLPCWGQAQRGAGEPGPPPRPVQHSAACSTPACASS